MQVRPISPKLRMGPLREMDHGFSLTCMPFVDTPSNNLVPQLLQNRHVLHFSALGCLYLVAPFLKHRQQKGKPGSGADIILTTTHIMNLYLHLHLYLYPLLCGLPQRDHNFDNHPSDHMSSSCFRSSRPSRNRMPPGKRLRATLASQLLQARVFSSTHVSIMYLYSQDMCTCIHIYTYMYVYVYV